MTKLPTIPADWAAHHAIHYQFLANQQVMLQDDQRVAAYYQGIAKNRADFADKIVLDVGAGTGILALFAAQAGARKVYAVEPTAVAEQAKQLVQQAGLGTRIEVIQSRVSELELPEPVDIILSEPWGFFLLHERIVEAVLDARDRFLKKNGRIFPCRARLWIAPFCDPRLYDAWRTKVGFWQQSDYYGIDLSRLEQAAESEIMSMPALGPVDPRQIMAPAVAYPLDLETMDRQQLGHIEIPFEFGFGFDTPIHGIAGWFDVEFLGSGGSVTLSTAPIHPPTHWWQLRFVFTEPIALRRGDVLRGTLGLTTNAHASYDVSFDGILNGSEHVRPTTFRMESYTWWSAPVG